MDPLAATAEHWDFTAPVPLPRGDWMRCPVCRSDDWIPRTFGFHRGQPHASIPFRCDAAFKCGRCAAVWSHGIVPTQADWERFVPYGEDGRNIQRPETRELLG